MPKEYQIGSAIFLSLFGVFVALEALKLKLGKFSRPDPGFFPFWLGLALAVIGLVLLIQLSRRKSDSSTLKRGLWQGRHWDRVLYSLAAMLLYAFFLDRLGYLITTFLLMFFLFRIVGAQRWWVTTLGSVTTSLFTYLLFKVWLQVQLPQGLWGI